jgi:transcriptional regulator NrdR family protein
MESRPTQQWRRRRKHCLNCGATGATIEVVVEPGIKAMVSEVRARGGFQTMVRDMPMVLVAEKLSRRKAS